MQKTNPSISCTVQNCAFHCREHNRCYRNEISVGTVGSHASSSMGTECSSFRLPTVTPEE